MADVMFLKHYIGRPINAPMLWCVGHLINTQS